MKTLTVEWAAEYNLYDNCEDADEPHVGQCAVQVVRLAEVDELIQEAVWAMERLVEMRSVLEPSVAVRVQLFLASPLVAEWRTRQEEETA